MQVVTKLTNWPTRLHRASINSFGYGGANAHAILESVDSVVPGYNDARNNRVKRDPTKLYVLPFSGSTTQSLEARIVDFARRLEDGETYNFDDVCHTLADRRSNLSKKGFLLASEPTAKTDFVVEKLVTPKKASLSRELGFVFTGQGAQWPQMGKELLETYPVFAETIDHLDSVLGALAEAPSWTLKDAMLEPAATSKVGDAAFSQPLCTAIQVGIVKLLRTWGVEPSVVAGHSSGEIAAAFASGLLIEEHAIIIAFYRGYAANKITSNGCMLAVGMDTDSADAIIDRLSLNEEICVACINSPESVTISGSTKGIDKLTGELQAQNVFAKKLATGGRGYHSFLMKEIGAEYENLVSKALKGLPMPSERKECSEPVRFFSSVGKDVEALASFSQDTTDFISPSYWRANLENPVQFNAAIKNITAAGKYHILEIGPHAALQLPIKQIRTFLGVSEDDLPYSPTLLRGKNADVCMKTLVGELYLSGHYVDFLAVNNICPSGDELSASVVHDLPPYRWSYTELLWNEPRPSTDLRNRAYVRHELLGSETVAANGIERCWRNIFKPAEVPWIDDHRLESQVVFPAAGYLAMAIEAMSQIKGWRPDDEVKPSFTFRNVNISSALAIQDGDMDTELFTMMYPEKISTTSTSGIWYTFSISSVQSGVSVSHCVGNISVSLSPSQKTGDTVVDATNYDEWRMGRWYEKLASEGLRFGPTFQTLTSMKTDKARVTPEALSTSTLCQRVAKSTDAQFAGTFYAVHPLVIDACLQAAIMGGTAGNLEKLRAFLPTFFGHLQISTPDASQLGSKVFIHSQSRSTGFSTKKINVTLRDNKNEVLVDMSDARLSLYAGTLEEEVDPSELNRHPCLRVVWKPDITRLDESRKSQLEAYLEQFLSDHHTLTENNTVGVMAGLVDLAGHKNPRLRVLEVGHDCDCKTKQWLDTLDNKTDFPRSREWNTGTFFDGEISTSPAGNPDKVDKIKLDAENITTYDVLLMPRKETTNVHWATIAPHLSKILSPQSIIIGRKSAEASTCLKEAGCKVFNLVGGIMLAIPAQTTTKLEGKDVVLVS